MSGRRLLRRVVIGVVVALQLVTVVRGYDDPHRVFAFQMFPEASRWQAEIYRVLPDGEEVPVDDGWAYRWDDLVDGRGLDRPDRLHHADAGLESQFAFLQDALDWVARNTPDDTTTRYLRADVTYFDNGRGPLATTFRSVDRAETAPP